MPVQWNGIKQNKPAIFDWLVFIFSLSIGLIFPSLKDLVSSSLFSSWMLAGIVLYIVGILLKRRPLYYRLARSGNKRNEISYFILLIIGHWVIMLAVIIFAEGAFRSITGLPQVPEGSPTSGLGTVTGICMAAFLTWLAFRPGSRSKKLLSEGYLFRRELAADILLISGVTMLSFVFWEKSLLPSMSYMSIDGIGDICILFIFLSVAYVMFYLPLRYLYLLEDHSGRQAWKRLSLIFTLLLIRALFTALSY